MMNGRGNQASAFSLPARLRAWVLALLIAGIIAFYFWTVMSSALYTWRVQNRHEGDYFNLLTDGFVDGHLYLKRDVPEALIHAENPYDPSKRPEGSAMHDVSYYRGRYYLYFGVTPVVTLYLPFLLLTGKEVPQHYGNFLYAAMGFACAAGLFLALRRRYFPGAGFGTAVAGVLALGLGSMVHAVLRRPSFWELPIASAYGFAMLTLVCVYHALHRRRAGTWLLLAGVSFGLAVGSRPTYVVAAPLLGAPLLLWWWRERSRGGWRPSAAWWRRAVAGGIGFGAVLAGLLVYNYARFGKLSEFGLNYQLTSAYEAKVTHFTPRFIPFNTYVYYLAPAQWSRYFPFVEVIRSPQKPAGYYGIEFVYGVLACLPLVWLALVAPFGLKRRPPREQGPLAAMLGSVALLYLPLAAVMLCFVTAAARYMVDFTPALVLLGCCGMLALDRLAPPDWRWWAARLGWGALAAVSVFFGVMASFQLHELLRANDPAARRTLARAFGWPSQWAEQIAGTKHGPIELTLRFAPKHIPERELLLSTGWEFYSDHVFVLYLDSTHVRFGFAHSGEKDRLSAPLEIDFGREHTLRVEAGSLYPPPAHPFFRGRTEFDVAAHARWLRLVFDGQTVMEGPQKFYDGSPGAVRLGGMGVHDPAYGRPFSGTIASTRRTGFTWMKDFTATDGALRFTVFFAPDPPRENQPLVVTGETGRANLLYVRYENPGQIRFGYDHWGVKGFESGLVDCPTPGPHEIEVRYGALLPPARDPLAAALRESLVVRFDGKVVWSQRVPYYEIAGRKPVLGHNDIGASTSVPQFSGAVTQVERVPAVVGPRGPGALRLQLMLPADRLGRSEPLVVTGPPGMADVLFVTYVDDRHVRFGFSHWGVQAWQSAPLAIDYHRAQTLQVQLASLAFPASAEEKYAGGLKLTLNGAMVWEQRVEFYRAAAATLAIGENRVGSATCDAVFSGGVVEIGGI